MKKKEQVRRAREKARLQESRAAQRTDRSSGGKEPNDRQVGPGSRSFRREQTVKTAKWNRFMFVRYLVAAAFFIGLYLACMVMAIAPGPALILPAIELVVALIVMMEMLSTITNEVEYLVWSRRLLTAACVADGVAFLITAICGPQVVFPIFNNATPGMVICLVLMAVKLLMIHRIILVRDRKDKRYALYQKVLKYND